MNGLCLVAAAVIHFTVGHPEHVYPLRRDVAVTNAPPVASVIGSNAISIRLKDGEALWGLGERFYAWNQRGHAVECWAQDMAQGGPSSSYFAVPFFISSGGWALFVNCTGKVSFDSRGDRLRVEVPESGIDAYMFSGTPREILAEYTQLVGRPAMPPAWVFQPWLSRNSYLGASEIDHVIDKMEQNGLKTGVVVLEAWAQGLQNFKFEERRYPKPREWIERLHQRGVYVVLWETPSIGTSASTYEEAKTNGFLVLNADGSEYVTDWLENGRKIDFRKPDARAWWAKLHEPLVAMGVDGFKTDGGERMPDPWFHNLHPFYYQRAVPSVTFARSASPPCAGNSLFWAGDQNADWNSLRRVVRAGMSAAMSGFPFWGHDIGGYTGTPMKKLYIRWLQLGAFSPIMQLHGITPREPWHYDDETLGIAKRCFDIRNILQPYLVDTARQSVEQGIPMLRPLVLQFPDDTKARQVDDEFMLGDDLLVAPVLNEFDERRIYLPAGEWLDLQTAETHTGPKAWLSPVGLGRIPVFVRAERSDKFRELAGALSSKAEPGVALELAGQINERGVVPAIRFMRGQAYEKIFLTVRNRSPREITGVVSCEFPGEVTVLPESGQRFTVAAAGEAHIAFYAALANGAAVDSYPIRIRATLEHGEVAPVTVILVKLPQWRVAAGDDASLAQWREEAPPVSQDGFVDVGRLFGSDLPKVCIGEAKFTSPRARKARLWVGSGDSISIRLNGEPVLDVRAFRSPERDENWTDVTLREGENVLVVKQYRDLGPAGWFLRIFVDR